MIAAEAHPPGAISPYPPPNPLPSQSPMPLMPSPAARSGLPAGIEGPTTATTTATISKTTARTKRPLIDLTSYPVAAYSGSALTLCW